VICGKLINENNDVAKDSDVFWQRSPEDFFVDADQDVHYPEIRVMDFFLMRPWLMERSEHKSWGRINPLPARKS
jgi:hypothetical protein